jgi:hypothetical protein
MIRSWRADPGGALLHPAPLLAIAVLLVNDHLLEPQWAHPLTGHLSDVAGLLFFPLLLISIAELMLRIGGVYRGPSNALLVAATAATAVVFTLTQTTALGGDAYRFGLGALQDPLAVVALAAGHGSIGIEPVSLTQDLNDLYALPVLLLTLAVGSERSRAAARVPASRDFLGEHPARYEGASEPAGGSWSGSNETIERPVSR